METCTELVFSVPWGVIAAKCWGHPSGKPFLGLHGWLGNANTFDKLAPLLPNNIYFVAIDFPGHGRSSCRPVGVPYNMFDWVVDVKWVVSQLGWKKFSLIGHSMGAVVASIYAGTFPDEMKTAILIENRIGTPEDPPRILANAAKFLTFNSRKNEKFYKVFPNVEAAIARLMKANPELTQESAKTLIRRRIINPQNPVKDGGIHIKSDPRLRLAGNYVFHGSTYVTTAEMAVAIYEHINCNIMIIYAKDCPLSPLLMGNSLLNERFADAMKKNAKYFEQVKVPGNHFVHLNDPGLLAQKVDSFLKKCDFKSKL